MSGGSFPRDTAVQVATEFRREFAFHFERLEDAGSLRRGAALCGDVEFVALAGPLQRVGFLTMLKGSKSFRGAKPGTRDTKPWKPKPDGRYWKIFHLRTGMFVDVWFAYGDNWGLIMAIRTGPPEFGRRMLQRWKLMSQGGCSDKGYLRLPGGKVVLTPTEDDVFRLIGIKPIPPDRREFEWPM